MPKDCRGLEITAASDAAVAAYDRTVRAYLGFARDTGDQLKGVYKADADMPMAPMFASTTMRPEGPHTCAISSMTRTVSR